MRWVAVGLLAAVLAGCAAKAPHGAAPEAPGVERGAFVGARRQLSERQYAAAQRSFAALVPAYPDSVVLLGPLLGAPLALAAALIDAGIGYAAGRALGLERVIPYVGRRAYRVWGQLPGRGVFAVAMLRLVSLLSATSIHLLCGAARVPFRAYAAGTAAVFVPGVLVLTVLGGLLRHTSLHPGPRSSLLTAGAAIVLATIVLRLRQLLLVKRYRAAQADQEERALFG